MNTFERACGGADPLHIRFLRKRRDGGILKADLVQDEFGYDCLQLTPDQLYGLVDGVAVADPEEWSRRFDPKDAIEQHLLRLVTYFEERAQANRRVRQHTVADTFDLAATRVREEIKELHKP